MWIKHETLIMSRCNFPWDTSPLRYWNTENTPGYVEDQLVLDRPRRNLWKKQSLEIEIGPGCKLIEHELVQDEYLRNLRHYDSLGQMFWQEKLDKSNHEHLQQIFRENKSDRMQKLRREIEFLERGMQRVKTRLSKIQDPLLTPTTLLTGIKSKQLIGTEYHDYPEYNQYTYTGIWCTDRTKLPDRKTNQDRHLSIKKIARRTMRPGFKKNYQIEHDDHFNCHIDKPQVKF